ncbi:lycopene cyclase domain-containing protein [Adhaeribacter aquaticus]|uniref:lycopene cyclase domain-containing protein n=1 Tax=Adhaeribacter aquaticus TaxID=299567 RepID=UPI0004224AE2|nr:lycopene cyclase domain-containing protein [Adhaeribacter aquaticus]
MYIYLYLNLFTIFFPFVLSFDKRVHFYTHWSSLFPAIALNALIFVIWDSFFTSIGVWGFNPDYLLGIYLFELPLEELLFFFTVPYACVFIYETLNTYIAKDFLQPYAKFISVFLILVLTPLAFIFLNKFYTSVTFLFLVLVQVIHLFTLQDKVLGRFYLAYLVHLVPFLLVNGVLTALPIVWYNDFYNLGLRISTIPIEDTMYSMLMLLITITVYEVLNERKVKQKAVVMV